ncbi:YkgJ family cysteine cluster protein [Maribellus comscasis]|uniref:YkgJ family cysteine cluster protein n=1 Tax=Maribellus comscasis TaxID=2681766 RepID=A0A6I6JT33_9BACT|nr:YkgJ family cysteine cluster protein [Maribellus comscasis]QGY43297.1 YkgJ family cysteine cluster protein [Maribellus comscasis]
MRKIKYKTPEELKILTDKNRAETHALIKKLKKKKPKELDDFIHELHIDAFSEFSCLDCANCCKTIGPRLTDKDIDRLAKHLKMKPSEFLEQYVKTDEDNDFVFREHPCPFLLPDNYCMVYENRPKACREYPHTDRKHFYQILTLSFKNCETCPVVYEIFEEMKTKKW